MAGRLIAAATILVPACAPAAAPLDPGSGWQGTIETSGDVTTVHNESGSMWGGPATLVEEASIGVEAGDEARMLGQVFGTALAGDRIYVLDLSVPVVRLYDLDGRYLMDVGGVGEGPGEFTRPSGIAVYWPGGPQDGAPHAREETPEGRGEAADARGDAPEARGGVSGAGGRVSEAGDGAPDARGEVPGGAGRLFVRDRGRINVYTLDGEFLESWPLQAGFGARDRMVVTSDGTLWVTQLDRSATPAPRERAPTLLQPLGPTAEALSPVRPPTLEFADGRLEFRGRSVPVPFWPRPVWSLAPSGAVLAGVPDRYRFEIRRPDGRATVVTRSWEPVPVHPDEAAWFGELATESYTSREPGWTWNGPEIPATKPAYYLLHGDESGRVWVGRQGPGVPNPECEVARAEGREPRGPCWLAPRFFDVFGDDGRYLGEVDLPGGRSIGVTTTIRDDTVVLPVEDEAGTIMVKRYRLVTPEGS